MVLVPKTHGECKLSSLDASLAYMQAWSIYVNSRLAGRKLGHSGAHALGGSGAPWEAEGGEGLGLGSN